MSDAQAVTNRSLDSIVLPRQPLWREMRGWAVWMVIAALLAYSWGPVEMSKSSHLITDWRNMAEFVSGFMHPELRGWQEYVSGMIETVEIAAWGTAVAVVFAIPLSILASSNVAPFWVVQPVRRLMDCSRAINEFVFALLFVVAVGLGPLAGVLALAVHNIGVIAKLFSEAVESIDPRPVEGIRSTGANKIQEVLFGVIPQVAPLWSSLTLYRFETNVRSATVLGIVGAGGIGQALYENVRGFQYGATATIVFIVIVTVMIIDVISAQLRKNLV